MSDRDDQILEAGLTELLGGDCPPDLSARILRAAADRQSAALDRAEIQAEPAIVPFTSVPASAPTISTPTILPMPVNGPTAANTASGPGENAAILPLSAIPLSAEAGKSKRRFGWLASIIAASLVVAMVSYSRMQKPVPNGNHDRIARPAPAPKNPADATAAKNSQVALKDLALKDPSERPVAPVAPTPAVPKAVAPPESPALVDGNPTPPKDPNVGPSQVGPSPPNVAPGGNILASSQSPPRTSVPRLSDADVVALVDEQIERSWRAANIECSPAASEEEWCRRTYLDVLGRIPTIDEITVFLQDKSPDKRTHLVDQLLGSDRYSVEYARNWTTIWTNLLIGRSGGMDPQRPVSREGLQHWLRRGFLKNKPYDQFVSELIAADGVNMPDEVQASTLIDRESAQNGRSDQLLGKPFNGAVNFLLDNLQGKQVSATNKVAELFLGTRIGCTQCHNHPFNEWKQQQFWEFNAFFKQAKPLRPLGEQAAALIDEDFAGESKPVNPSAAEIFYEQRNGFLKVAYPQFEGTKIDPCGYVNIVNRRDELARLMIQSQALREAIVNRMWGHFFGYGFTTPLDDMGPHNPPSHPELLARLGDELAAHDFDLKRLIRWIVLSKPYALSSRVTPSNLQDDPAQLDATRGDRLLFSRFYPRQMEAEQLYESLRCVNQSAGNQPVGSVEAEERQKHAWLQQFVIMLETDDNNEASTFDGTIPQSLMMMNGDLVRQATRIDSGSFLFGLATSKLHTTKKIEQLYRAALGRKPAPGELITANRLWAFHRGDSAAALQDIYWALLNSNEFIINH